MRTMGCAHSSQGSINTMISRLSKDTFESGSLRPPYTRWFHVFPSKETIDAVDDFALKTPVVVESSMKTLSGYLNLATRMDLLKTRAFFTWITSRIRWSHDRGLGTETELCLETILDKRSADARGYCLLLQELCSLANIPCYTVMGLLKDTSYDYEADLQDKASLPNHAWNLVYLCGDWRFVDAMLGSASRDSLPFVKDRSSRATAQSNDFYFLTEPEHAIQSHYPLPALPSLAWCSLRCQLLVHPLTLREFHRSLQVLPLGLQVGLEPVSHKNAVLEVCDSERVVMKMQRDSVVAVRCDLVELGARNERTHWKQRYLLTCLGRESLTITIRPPVAARYLLDIHVEPSAQAKTSYAPRTFHPVAAYVVRCLEPCSDARPLPVHNGSYGTAHAPFLWDCGLDPNSAGPCELCTATGEVTVTLRMVTPVPVEAQLFHSHQGEISQHVTTWYRPDEGFLFVLASLSEPGFYRLSLSTSRVPHAVNYLVESIARNPKPTTFPEQSSHSLLAGCRLLEPLSRSLPALTRVRVRLEGGRLSSVKPDEMQRQGDVWEGDVWTGKAGSHFCLYGVKDRNFGGDKKEEMHRLFVFEVA